MIENIKIFKIGVGDCDFVAGLNEEQVKSWFKDETGQAVEHIEEVPLDTKINAERNDGVGFEVLSIREILTDLQNNNIDLTFPMWCGYMKEGLQHEFD